MADALSTRLPHYNSARPEVLQPVIPSKQLAAPGTTSANGSLNFQMNYVRN